MLFRGEVTGHRPQQADDEEDRADDDMSTMEAGGHEKRCTINIAAEMKLSVRAVVGLDRGDGEPQQNRQAEAPGQALPIVFQESVVRPGNGGARCQKDQGVEQRQMLRIESLNSFRRPYAAGRRDATDVVNSPWEQ